MAVYRGYFVTLRYPAATSLLRYFAGCLRTCAQPGNIGGAPFALGTMRLSSIQLPGGDRTFRSFQRAQMRLPPASPRRGDMLCRADAGQRSVEQAVRVRRHHQRFGPYSK